MDLVNISSFIDHTLLKPACTDTDIKKLCEEAVQHKFAAVCIPPFLVKQAAGWISGSTVKLATVAGFPFGYEAAGTKVAAIKQAIVDGADELDIVINLIALKSGSWSYLEKEMEPLIELAHANHKLVKIIIETGLLTDAEIIRCCELYGRLGADFIKTSTGYADQGATVEAVRLMRKHLPEAVRIKASGGIRTYDFARQLIDAGAARLGSSASIAIVNAAMSA